MRRFATLACVALAASLALAQDPVTAALEPVAGTSGTAGPFGYYTAMRIEVGDEPAEGLAKEPTYLSSKPRYGALKLGNGSDAIITVVLDEPEVGVTSFLWVDANNDNDLTNDGDGRWQKGNATNFISDFELTARYLEDGKEVTAPYFMRFYRFKDFSKRPTLLDKVMCYRSNHREGKIALDGKEYRLCVSDDNTDGCFDDLDNGRVAIDIDGNGNLDGGKDSVEAFQLSEPFNVSGASWRVRFVSPQGDSITLVPAGIDVPAKTPPSQEPPPANPPPVNPPPVNPPPAQPKVPTLEELQAKFQAERGKASNERYSTIQQIGALRTREAADFLRAALVAETEAVVRTYLVNALATNGTPEAFKILVTLLDREKEDVSLRTTLARALGEFSTEEAFKRLVALYKEGKKEDAVRYAVAQAIRGFVVEEFGKEMDRFFFDALDDTYAYVRAEAVRHLAPKKDKRVLAVAKAILEKETLAPVRQAAVEALKVAGTQDAFLALFEAAGKESDEATKKAMIDAMVTFTDPAVVKWISAQGTNQKDPALRRVAVALLGRSKEPAAIKAVVKALRDPDASVRVAAIDALIAMGAKDAADEVLKLTGDQDPSVAAAAIEALGLLGEDSPEVVKRLLGLLKSRAADVLNAAMGALGRMKAVEALKPILGLLDHETWQVRAGAIEALVKFREKEAILALIERLAKEDGRLKHDIAAALKKLTGQKLGTNAETWKKWWADEGVAFVVPPESETGDAAEEGMTTYYGIPVVSKRICFLLDISGSMSASAETGESQAGDKSQKNRLDVARKELIETIERLAKDVRFNVVLFDDRVEPWEKALVLADDAHKADAKKFLDRQRPRGGTNIFDPLEAALMDKDVDTVFLLSDGAPGSGKFVQAEDILREIRKLNRSRKVVIHTIAIGLDTPLMRELAKQNGGKAIVK